MIQVELKPEIEAQLVAKLTRKVWNHLSMPAA
jgi:hypothetical protein